ncbi:MAG: excinuclease ABC subunit UvrB [Patescibacteria group bacterium]
MKSDTNKAKSQQNRKFELVSPYGPAGDQEKVIDTITSSLGVGTREQTILGVTGSGKTFMMASIVDILQKPTLVIAHNKTLAAQLAEEFRRFFPHNAVHYFVSYYDYYQPESYIPRSDTYIEKQTQINEEIDRLRNAATQSLLTRKDVLIVASVSCIYGLGNPEDFAALKIDLEMGQKYKIDKIIRKLIDLQFTRTNLDLKRGVFRLRGDNLELIPSSEEIGYRFSFYGDELELIQSFHPVSGQALENIESYTIFPAKQYVTTQEKIQMAISKIEKEVVDRVDHFNKEGLLLQAQRIKERTYNDLEMLQTLGYVGGIENYSVYFDGRQFGEPPTTLLDYFPDDSITFIDESHMTLSQISSMYNGDRSRKQTLVEYGFRLPSAMNNRPLKINEFYDKMSQLVYVSATPGNFEFGKTDSVTKNANVEKIKRDPKAEITVAEAIIRPTGLLDPEIILKPVKNQVDDVLEQVRQRVAKGQRVLITTLTKRFSEELDLYFKQINVKSAYIHSDVDTMERIDILSDLRRGKYDVLVGINLLREGLDLPEVSLVAIFDADKEGFLRSKTSLVQIIGRAARHSEGKVIMYADSVTDSMKYAIEETERRRELQQNYNKEHNIIPKNVVRDLKTIADDLREEMEQDETYGKSGATYSTTGWKPVEEDKVMFTFDEKKSRRKSKSIHSEDTKDRKSNRGKQVFADFDQQKESFSKDLESQNLSISELKSRLQVAIDAMNFEEAAALRDLIDKKMV